MLNSTKNLTKIKLITVAALFLSACQAAPNPTPTSRTQILAVSGLGFTDIPKTTSQISLGIEAQAATSAEAQAAMAPQADAAIKLLKTNPAATKITTTGVTLTPRYKSETNGQQSIIGYTATNTVRFQIDPDKTGKLLDDVIKAGATRINNVTLMATDTAIAEAQKTAINAASKNAQAQAESALSALGLKQTAIVNVQINGATIAPNNPEMFQDLEQANLLTQSSAKVPSTPVVAGEQRISATVTLQVSYQTQS